jgi:hypothetical protein
MVLWAMLWAVIVRLRLRLWLVVAPASCRAGKRRAERAVRRVAGTAEVVARMRTGWI